MSEVPPAAKLLIASYLRGRRRSIKAATIPFLQLSWEPWRLLKVLRDHLQAEYIARKVQEYRDAHGLKENGMTENEKTEVLTDAEAAAAGVEVVETGVEFEATKDDSGAGAAQIEEGKSTTAESVIASSDDQTIATQTAPSDSPPATPEEDVKSSSTSSEPVAAAVDGQAGAPQESEGLSAPVPNPPCHSS